MNFGFETLTQTFLQKRSCVWSKIVKNGTEEKCIFNDLVNLLYFFQTSEWEFFFMLTHEISEEKEIS